MSFLIISPLSSCTALKEISIPSFKPFNQPVQALKSLLPKTKANCLALDVIKGPLIGIFLFPAL